MAFDFWVFIYLFNFRAGSHQDQADMELMEILSSAGMACIVTPSCTF